MCRPCFQENCCHFHCIWYALHYVCCLRGFFMFSCGYEQNTDYFNFLYTILLGHPVGAWKGWMKGCPEVTDGMFIKNRGGGGKCVAGDKRKLPQSLHSDAEDDYKCCWGGGCLHLPSANDSLKGHYLTETHPLVPVRYAWQTVCFKVFLNVFANFTKCLTNTLTLWIILKRYADFIRQRETITIFMLTQHASCKRNLTNISPE